MKNIVFLILCPLLLFSQTKKKETTIRNTYVTKFGEPQLKETQSYETSYSSDGKRIGGVTDKQWERKFIINKTNNNDSIVITYYYDYVSDGNRYSEEFYVYQKKEVKKLNPKAPATHFAQYGEPYAELFGLIDGDFQILEVEKYSKIFTGSKVSKEETYRHVKDYGAAIETKDIYKYDSNNNNTSITLYGENGKVYGKIINKYDSNNNMTEQLEYNGDGEVLSKLSRKYDSNNNIIEEVFYNNRNEIDKKTIKKYDAKNYNYETIKYSVFCETNEKVKKGDLYVDEYTYKRKLENGMIDKEIYYNEFRDCDGEIPATCGAYDGNEGCRYKYDQNGELLETKYYNITFYKGKPVLGSINSKLKKRVIKDKNGYEIEIEDHYYTNKDGKTIITEKATKQISIL